VWRALSEIDSFVGLTLVDAPRMSIGAEEFWIEDFRLKNCIAELH
jgi:hypothetical protein